MANIFNNVYFLVFVPVSVAVLYSLFIIYWLSRQPNGSVKMQEISKAIEIGSGAFLNRQYKTIILVSLPLVLLMYYFLGDKAALGFVAGALASATAGYIGMNVAVRSNVKVAEAAKHGVAPALSLAFRAGSVTGYLVVALALLVVGGFYLWAGSYVVLVSLGFGASLISVFARLGGGIFTKAADVGADLVGKLEIGISEDDPRNPAVIADNVGDNVGDCAGMAADLFETYVVTLVAGILLSSVLYPSLSYLPLALGGLAIIASVIGGFFVRLGGRQSIMGALYRGLIVTLLVAAGLFYWRPVTAPTYNQRK
jgi:K(+)-stimulated pyrophosphate-energized sodium pump